VASRSSLQFLLDEHIAVAVAAQLNVQRPASRTLTLARWNDAAYLGATDDVILKAAQVTGLTLVTYDLRTIPGLLKQWGEEGAAHGGVVFVDTRSITPTDIGGLVRALVELWDAEQASDWTNRVVFMVSTPS